MAVTPPPAHPSRGVVRAVGEYVARHPRRSLLAGAGLLGAAPLIAGLLGESGGIVSALGASTSGADGRGVTADGAAQWAVQAGVLELDDAGAFRTDAVMTRRSMAQALYRFAGSPDYPLPAVPLFTDVAHDAAGAREIGWLKGRGVAFGGADGAFMPDAPVTCADGAALVRGLLGAALPDGTDLVAGVSAPGATALTRGDVAVMLRVADRALQG